VNNKRIVSKQLSVFDIVNYICLDIPGKRSVRVMHEYDSLDNKQAFTVLSRDIPEESAKAIVAWLEENTRAEDLIYGLDSGGIDFRPGPLSPGLPAPDTYS
jgi:hypothetical protein